MPPANPHNFPMECHKQKPFPFILFFVIKTKFLSRPHQNIPPSIIHVFILKCANVKPANFPCPPLLLNPIFLKQSSKMREKGKGNTQILALFVSHLKNLTQFLNQFYHKIGTFCLYISFRFSIIFLLKNLNPSQISIQFRFRA
jgi:hypothetical protein